MFKLKLFIFIYLSILFSGCFLEKIDMHSIDLYKDNNNDPHFIVDLIKVKYIIS